MSVVRCLRSLLLFAALGLPGCDTGLPEFKDSARLSAEARDREAEEMLAKKQTPEARAWLAVDKGHGLWKVDRATAKRLVDSLYAAGAPQVYVSNIVKHDGSEWTAEFMAELPTDPAARARVFQTAEAFWKSYLPSEGPEELQELIESDNGQKFMMFNFDL